MAGLPEIRTQFTETWNNIDKGTKIKLVGILLGALLLISAFALLTKPAYEVLFANLAASDAGEITTRLEEINTPYQLTDNGSSILVPKKELYKVRNQLVMEGLPRGGVVDFGIFDQSRLGTTDFERRVQYRRALQGELTRTITAMAGIKNAWVQISLPEPRLYQAQEERASAAILLDNIGVLSSAQVQGIVDLVSHSVEGLEPDLVTVVNTQGEVLSDGLETQNVLGLTTSQLELQRQIERELEQGLRSMLEMVIGLGKVVAKVSAEIDFDQKEITTQQYDPGAGDGILRSIQELERTFQGGETGLGIPGTTSNIPDLDIPTYQANQGGESEYYERETLRNFEVSEIQEHLVVAPGSIKRLSVAVLIDEEELSLNQRLAIEESVTAAVGADYNRGDQVIVTALPFAASPFAEFDELLDAASPREIGLLNYLLLGGILLTGVILVVFLVRRRRLARQDLILGEEVAVSEEEEEALFYPQEEQIVRQMERLTRERPDVVARLISTLLSED